MVYPAAGTCETTGFAGDHSQPGSSGRYDGDHEAVCRRTKRCDPLFSYSPEQAKEYVKMGFYLGIGGVVTFKNAKKLKEVVQEIPLESLVLETDSPYLAPVPNRGKRNSSLNLVYVAEEIAGLKGISYEEVVRQTTENAKNYIVSKVEKEVCR